MTTNRSIPPSDRSTATSIYMKVSLLDWITARAKRRDISVSAWVVEAIEEKLQREGQK